MCILADFFSLSARCGLATTTSTARALTARRRWTKRWVGMKGFDVPLFFLPSVGTQQQQQQRLRVGGGHGVTGSRSNLLSFLSTCKSWQMSFRDRSPI